jgi:hypothetical protein
MLQEDWKAEGMLFRSANATSTAGAVLKFYAKSRILRSNTSATAGVDKLERQGEPH